MKESTHEQAFSCVGFLNMVRICWYQRRLDYNTCCSPRSYALTTSVSLVPSWQVVVCFVSFVLRGVDPMRLLSQQCWRESAQQEDSKN